MFTHMGRTGRRAFGLGAALLTAVALAACGGSGSSGHGNAKVIKVAYGSTFIFDTPQLATRWWNQVRQQFEAENPGVKIQFIPIPGGYNDIVTKLDLLYRSPSTAPDVAELFTGQIGQLASSGYLAPLNSHLNSASWWANFPAPVQDEGKVGGQVYAVNQGENDNAIYYNKDMFKQAGLPVPWTPKNWSDILAAAHKIKSSIPGVIPLWVMAGSGAGANTPLFGFNNLLFGTSSPTIQHGDKWVVRSSGITSALTFMSQVYSGGLGAPASTLFAPSGPVAPTTLFPQHKLAIAIGPNFYAGSWTKSVNAPYWPQAAQVVGVTPMPSENGGGPVTALAGEDFAMSSHSGNPSAAWKLINIMENRENSIDSANWAGYLPPNKAYWTDPAYAQFAPPFNTQFAQLMPHATLTPSAADYPVWVQGNNNATTKAVQSPGTSVSALNDIFASYVSNQLGGSSTTTLP